MILAAVIAATFAVNDAQAAIICDRTVTADLVVIDQPLMYNRLGAANINGMIFALRRDVIKSNTLLPLTAGGTATPGNVELRPDRRPRPLVLRVRQGDCLTVNLENLLTEAANPLQPVLNTAVTGIPFAVKLDDQPTDRVVGFHAAGMQLVNSIDDDGSMVGRNNLGLAADNPVLGLPPSEGAIDDVNGSLIAPGESTSYHLYAEKEGVFLVTSEGVTIGSDGNEGHISNGLFGQVIVEPAGARIYRGQVHEEEMRLATDMTKNSGSCPEGSAVASGTPGKTCDGHPILNYEALYPNVEPWLSEGKAGLPVLNMLTAGNEIVHSEINAVVAGPNTDGTFPNTTYPLESVNRRNPTVPNRLEPFRDFSSQFHDETVNGQAFPGFYVRDPVFRFVLAGVKDAFMINYGSGGIGSEIIANRLGVGPMHDCLDCAYEEFFLTSFTVADPAMLVNVPANVGLEDLLPGVPPPQTAVGPKATFAIGAEDPANIHHSYTGDFTKIRNTHVGKEQHVFHLHNHQWLYNPNDDNSNYMDAQGTGPGAGYTYEINFGGSGNRNKSAGDSIYHCHFYPHFAQGMWYHWRHHDVMEMGTVLAATANDDENDDGYHDTPWALANTTPAVGARALPDGEIVAGTPIPAVVPLPGKAMAPMPMAGVTVRANPNTTIASVYHPLNPGGVVPVGSLASVPRPTVLTNPGYPFWIAGIEDIVGQRPPTPPLDMLTKAQAMALNSSGDPLWAKLDPDQADGWDGGLPRHSLDGYAAGGEDEANVVSPNDFSKVIGKAKPVYYPEEGTDLEQVAMAFHAIRNHPSYKVAFNGVPEPASFVTNGGGGPVVGAPYHNPCIDDEGTVLENTTLGKFFDGNLVLPGATQSLTTLGRSIFTSDNPRIYKGTFLQFDAVLNKVGYHFPQQRIIALWQDAGPIINKQKTPEPLVFRFNTFDCMVYHNANLVPEVYEMDDYEVRTPTDIIAQHIHLPKWDLTTADGAANGWNYEDGTLSPGAVRERIHAINTFVGDGGTPAVGTGSAPGFTAPTTPLVAKPHPYFAGVAAGLGGRFPGEWLGARTTTQRWFADPVVNVEGVDRGLGIIFTHDHYGPSTHQQVGLYATALVEPAGSRWVHNETGQQLGYNPKTGAAARTATAVNPDTGPYTFSDGGPTSWQAAILPPGLDSQTGEAYAFSDTLQPYREFYFEFSDFQHAYEAGVYVGAGQDGLPLPGTGPAAGPVVANAGNRDFSGRPEDAFRFAINPPARPQKNPVFPDLFVESTVCVKNALGVPLLGRPCPTAIDVQDPGILVVNYRHEPVGLRIYDPRKVGPDGKRGMQADGERGDLAFALQSRTDRAIAGMNVMPNGATVINGTRFPPHINVGGFKPGDPFTPMIRTFPGDVVRVKMQAGGNEEEHNASIQGMKWLQAGSGHGRAPNSGWRNAQASGISEQFTLTVPVVPSARNVATTDYAYSMDYGNDGWWSGMWGIFRAHNNNPANLFVLPGGSSGAPTVTNLASFTGACPTGAPTRPYNITAVLANSALTNALGVTIPTPATTVAGSLQRLVATQHVGGPLNAAGGTLVYNHRPTSIPQVTLPADDGGTITIGGHQGPIHDPTAILFVRTEDLNPNGTLKATAPVEPLVLRAEAGDCIQVTLRNRLPALRRLPGNQGNNSTAPDLATYSMIQGVVKRDRFDPQGATTFNVNLFRPSSWVSLAPQLVALDQGTDAGFLVGENQANKLAVPQGAAVTYRWYAGDVAFTGSSLVATPVEFGGSSLMPADRVKQGAKSLVGALVIEPQNSVWTENTQVFDHQDGLGTRLTRAQATVNAPDPLTGAATSFRDFSLVLTKGLTQYYRDGTPVEHMNGEGVGIPEDSQEASGMAFNYGIEPLWFRFGVAPNAPFGGAGCGTTENNECFGDIPNSHQAYSNVLPVDRTVVGSPQVGDPVTPVFFATAGQQARIRITNPYGTTRGSTFALHGHVWQRDPYVCDDNQYGLIGKCNAPATGSIFDPPGTPLVGSRKIGNNPIGFAQGGQESWTPATHFDIVLPSAGGCATKDVDSKCVGVPGDYLFRDKGSFGNASGLWGILRVE
ncbi:MAG: hypothetical protein A2V92_05240 [Candidatus Muproteobacteria bacterium RBG_16_65_31]|uniref:Plastocyanin-like domain-containing protein n=1 Tax=Candidatus Muproteobacteria bacterium RBG_16_65_31 TaxID=1817759 RepID=A0A1F6TJF7_9PROT|nr:MAG: hypothetical protein A2V92_05240 [Candidatus Muproteobacteria bacterium RBG_16_65_31]